MSRQRMPPFQNDLEFKEQIKLKISNNHHFPYVHLHQLSNTKVDGSRQISKLEVTIIENQEKSGGIKSILHTSSEKVFVQKYRPTILDKIFPVFQVKCLESISPQPKPVNRQSTVTRNSSSDSLSALTIAQMESISSFSAKSQHNSNYLQAIPPQHSTFSAKMNQKPDLDTDFVARKTSVGERSKNVEEIIMHKKHPFGPKPVDPAPLFRPKSHTLKCRHCPQTFNALGFKKAHEKTHGTKYRCSYCQTGFNRLSTLCRHKLRVHFKSACRFCDLDFETPESLRIHRDQVHMVNNDNQSIENGNTVDIGPDLIPPSVAMVETPAIGKRVKPYRCDTCGSRFVSDHGLWVHKVNKICKAISSRGNVCEKCDTFFPTGNSRRSHICSSPSNYLIPKKTLHRQRNRRRKMVDVPRGHRIKCTLCKKVFITATGLKLHTVRFHPFGKINDDLGIIKDGKLNFVAISKIAQDEIANKEQVQLMEIKDKQFDQLDESSVKVEEELSTTCTTNLDLNSLESESDFGQTHESELDIDYKVAIMEELSKD